ncbi:MAG: hypothetical protein EWM73_03480 [Nitrospira sp.]|nr:MAG: hypothetical protein EWM73_03480 [Nitrospira sp.]
MLTRPISNSDAPALAYSTDYAIAWAWCLSEGEYERKALGSWRRWVCLNKE